MILAVSQLASRFTRVDLIISPYSRISVLGSIVLFEFQALIVVPSLSQLPLRLFSNARLGNQASVPT